MEKEQVIEKLEVVFDVACKRFVKAGGNVSPEFFSEIRGTGELLISAKRNVQHDVEKASEFINKRVDAAVSNRLDMVTIAEKIERGKVTK